MKAAFIDKDGTLIEDVPYNVDPARIVLQPGARAGVQALAAAGYAIIVITNQSGVARGLFEEAALGPVAARLAALLGVGLSGFFHCPHHPQGQVARFAVDCACRKPQPGLILHAAEVLGIDLAASWMIGDILNDIEAGNRAGCRTLLIDNGGETEWRGGVHRQPDYVCANLAEAAAMILAASSVQPIAPRRVGVGGPGAVPGGVAAP